jgi:hypothetical protein
MNLKPLVAATLLALACNSGQSANTNWGPHGVLRSALGLSPGGAIAETFSFSLDQASVVSSLLNLTGSFSAASYGLASVGLDGLLGTADDVELARWSATGVPTLQALSLDAGQYYYSFTATATALGAYSLSSTAAPVPEPAAWAAMAAGLVLLGVWCRRRTGPRG